MANELDEAAFFADVTDTSIMQANLLLEWLLQQLEPNWKDILQKVCSETEYDGNVRNVQAKLEMLGLHEPLGIWAGGTGSIKIGAGLTQGEESQRAIRLLKKSGRILQAGKGRGKAIVVLSDKPLNLEGLRATMPVVATSPMVRAAGDTVAMLEQVAENFRASEQQRQMILEELAKIQEHNAELQDKLDQAHKELDRIKAERNLTTWG